MPCCPSLTILFRRIAIRETASTSVKQVWETHPLRNLPNKWELGNKTREPHAVLFLPTFGVLNRHYCESFSFILPLIVCSRMHHDRVRVPKSL